MKFFSRKIFRFGKNTKTLAIENYWRCGCKIMGRKSCWHIYCGIFLRRGQFLDEYSVFEEVFADHKDSPLRTFGVSGHHRSLLCRRRFEIAVACVLQSSAFDFIPAFNTRNAADSCRVVSGHRFNATTAETAETSGGFYARLRLVPPDPLQRRVD